MLLAAARCRSSSLSGDLCLAASRGGCSLESGDEVPVARVPVPEAGEIVVACDARREIWQHAGYVSGDQRPGLFCCCYTCSGLCISVWVRAKYIMTSAPHHQETHE
ncbi:hypothetical protein EJB05_02422 [Eragrostis curvula]|uniref:Uncharacterized protein n=1 Tax=Eragrostis curvula TaxID=38414 RepID=A0A5J9WUL8_9POAL|nr:hypothetical protein EJB05_02422 [Eragrostis curvula]